MKHFASEFSVLVFFVFFSFKLHDIAKLIKLRTHTFLAENTKPSRKGEYGDGVDESAERVGRVHDDEGTQFGGGTRRSRS